MRAAFHRSVSPLVRTIAGAVMITGLAACQGDDRPVSGGTGAMSPTAYDGQMRRGDRSIDKQRYRDAARYFQGAIDASSNPKDLGVAQLKLAEANTRLRRFDKARLAAGDASRSLLEAYGPNDSRVYEALRIYSLTAYGSDWIGTAVSPLVSLSLKELKKPMNEGLSLRGDNLRHRTRKIEIPRNIGPFRLVGAVETTNYTGQDVSDVSPLLELFVNSVLTVYDTGPGEEPAALTIDIRARPTVNGKTLDVMNWFERVLEVLGRVQPNNRVLSKGSYASKNGRITGGVATLSHYSKRKSTSVIRVYTVANPSHMMLIIAQFPPNSFRLAEIVDNIPEIYSTSRPRVAI